VCYFYILLVVVFIAIASCVHRMSILTDKRKFRRVRQNIVGHGLING